jgi:multidrug transporter EmrE-like cation transporter
MGGAKKHGIDSSLMQLMSSLLTIVVCCALVVCGVYPSLDVSQQTGLYAFAMYFCVGASGYILNETMARAMERGPNGLVWGILQSGTVIPFIVGVLFHHVPTPPLRIGGMVMILMALLFMSSDRHDDSRKAEGKSWLYLSFVAFMICGLQQTINNEPSYSEEIRQGVHAVYRCLFLAVGSLLSAIYGQMRRGGLKTLRENVKRNFRLPFFWLFSFGEKAIGIFGTLYLTFNGMDRMAKLGYGAISYPVMVVSCIAGFSLYSILALREKCTWKSATGLVCCILGIIGLSL